MQADRIGKKFGKHGTRENALQFFYVMTTLSNVVLNGKPSPCVRCKK
jgi:hypothetical protein